MAKGMQVRANLRTHSRGKSNAGDRRSAAELQLCGHAAGSNPLAEGMQSATVQTPGCGEPGAAVGTDALSLEGIEGLTALAALPEVSHWWCGVAAGTGKAVAAWQLRQTREEARVLPSTPAIHQHEDSENSIPNRLRIYRQNDEPGHADEAEDGGDHETAGASEHKPKQRTQNLAAIERIDRQDVEDQQAEVDVCDGAQKLVEVGNGFIPSQ